MPTQEGGLGVAMQDHDQRDRQLGQKPSGRSWLEHERILRDYIESRS